MSDDDRFTGTFDWTYGPPPKTELIKKYDLIKMSGRTYVVSDVQPTEEGWTSVSFIADPTEEPSDD